MNILIIKAVLGATVGVILGLIATVVLVTIAFILNIPIVDPQYLVLMIFMFGLIGGVWGFFSDVLV